MIYSYLKKTDKREPLIPNIFTPTKPDIPFLLEKKQKWVKKIFVGEHFGDFFFCVSFAFVRFSGS